MHDSHLYLSFNFSPEIWSPIANCLPASLIQVLTRSRNKVLIPNPALNLLPPWSAPSFHVLGPKIFTSSLMPPSLSICFLSKSYWLCIQNRTRVSPFLTIHTQMEEHTASPVSASALVPRLFSTRQPG